MEVFVILILVLGTIALAVYARKVAEPKVVKISGPVPHPDLWMPGALDAACKWSIHTWTWELFESENDDGSKAGKAEVRTTEGDLILVTFPLAEPEIGEIFLVHIKFEQFKYRRGPLLLLLMGKYPESHMFRMRKRLMSRIRKTASKAQQAKTLGESSP